MFRQSGSALIRAFTAFTTLDLRPLARSAVATFVGPTVVAALIWVIWTPTAAPPVPFAI